MILYILYFLAAFGAAYVAGYATISLPLRAWLAKPLRHYKINGEVINDDELAPYPPFMWLLALLECPACLGWWIGLLSAIVAPALIEPLNLMLGPLPYWTFAFATCASNFILGVITKLIHVE